jgi:hypothetical protein
LVSGGYRVCYNNLYQSDAYSSSNEINTYGSFSVSGGILWIHDGFFEKYSFYKKNYYSIGRNKLLKIKSYGFHGYNQELNMAGVGLKGLNGSLIKNLCMIT